MITKLANAEEIVEQQKIHRLPYKFTVDHDISTRPKLLSTLRDLQLKVAQANQLIALIDAEFVKKTSK